MSYALGGRRGGFGGWRGLNSTSSLSVIGFMAIGSKNLFVGFDGGRGSVQACDSESGATTLSFGFGFGLGFGLSLGFFGRGLGSAAGSCCEGGCFCLGFFGGGRLRFRSCSFCCCCCCGCWVVDL